MVNKYRCIGRPGTKKKKENEENFFSDEIKGCNIEFETSDCSPVCINCEKPYLKWINYNE